MTVYSIFIDDVYQESWETFQDAFDRCLALDLMNYEPGSVSIIPEQIPDFNF